MNNVSANDALIKCVKANDLVAVAKLLESNVKVVVENAPFSPSSLIMLDDRAFLQLDYDYVFNWCIEYAKWDMVLKLIEYGADVHARGDRALSISASEGRLDIVSALLKLGADANASTTSVNGFNFYSALELSVTNNHASVVTALLEAGADVRADDDCALRLSVQHYHFEIMEELLERGASVHCNNKQILIGLQKRFDEKIADILLPYCDARDYEYFPEWYIKAKIVPTKGARSNG